MSTTKTITVNVSIEVDSLDVEILGEADEKFVLRPERIKQAAEATPPDTPGEYYLTLEYDENEDIVTTEWMARDDALPERIGSSRADENDRPTP